MNFEINSNKIEQQKIEQVGLSEAQILRERMVMISGKFTPIFCDMLWVMVHHDFKAIEDIYKLLENYYVTERKVELMNTIQLLVLIIGMEFPEDIHSVKEIHLLDSFLQEFLLDFQDVILDYREEKRARL